MRGCRVASSGTRAQQAGQGGRVPLPARSHYPAMPHARTRARAVSAAYGRSFLYNAPCAIFRSMEHDKRRSGAGGKGAKPDSGGSCFEPGGMHPKTLEDEGTCLPCVTLQLDGLGGGAGHEDDIPDVEPMSFAVPAVDDGPFDEDRFSHLAVAALPTEYGSFKKWLAKAFHQLREAAETGVFPDEPTVQRFIAACRRMTELDGRGSETFSAFLAQAHRFAEAVRGGDHEAGRVALDALEAHRRRCHARYR